VARVSIPLMVLGTIVTVLAATDAWSLSLFDNWGRCRNARLQPDRRVAYCSRLINNGGGANSEIVVFTILGGVYRAMHRYGKAIESYTRALGYRSVGVSSSDRLLASPDALTAALDGRAEVYALTGQRELALADTAQIFELAPGAAASFATRCRIRAIMNSEPDKAAGDCSEAMKRDAKNTKVLGTVGYLQFRLGHLKEAAADFNAALNVDPKLAGALYMRGVIKRRNGDTAGGNADIAAATEQNVTIAANFADIGVSP
jgi:tetratricopeptide (TPR) repeat protein